jgi:DNA-directed RNA polymerase specialized sigma24 family protein
VEELYRRNAGELRGYLHRRAGQAGSDLLGEVFVVALQRLDDLPEPDLRRAWLFGTARRLLLAAERNTWQRHHSAGLNSSSSRQMSPVCA